MANIFISYGREPEVVQFVTKLKRDLEENRFAVLADIPPGSSWYGDAGTVLRSCRALIAVITKKYLNTPYCSNELYAADRDGKKLFFAFLEDIDFGASDPARAVQYLVSKTNWTTSFNFKTGVNDYGTSLRSLVQSLKGKTKPRRRRYKSVYKFDSVDSSEKIGVGRGTSASGDQAGKKK